MVLASASFFGGAWAGTGVLRYRSWIQRFVARSLMPTKRQRCWLPPLGARVPASSTLRTSASGIGSGRMYRRARWVYIASKRPSSSAISLLLPARVQRGPVARSVEDDAAVDVEGLPGDVARARRREEHGQGGDVLGLVRAPERDRGVAPPLHLVDRDALRGGARPQILVRQRADGGARADGVHVDVVLGELERRQARHADDGALAAGVDRVRGAGEPLACDGGDVHDHAAAPGDHLARDALQAEEDALAVDPHDAVPVLFGEIHDVGAARDAGVVDEDIDLAEGVDGLADHPVDALEVADVGPEGQALAAERADGVGRRLGGPLLEVDRYDVRAALRQGQRRRAADAARGTGDDRDTIGERLARVGHR